MLLVPTRCVLVFCLLGGTLAAQEQWHLGFDDDAVDQPPAGFIVSSMQQPGGGWFVQRPTASEGCLAHTAVAKASGFSIAVADRPVPHDLTVSVRLRASSGARHGGLVWRYQNEQNFYALLLDLQEGEVDVYRVSPGSRVRLDGDEGLELDPAAWHSLKVVHADATLRVMLGGIRVFEEQDRRYDWRSAPAGRVGVIATGDSEICFDDLKVETRRGRR